MVSPWTSPFVVQAHDDRGRAWCAWLPWISRSVCAIRRPCCRTAWRQWKCSIINFWTEEIKSFIMNFFIASQRVTTEIQMRLKTAEMLGAKGGDLKGEKEQIVQRLTSAHQRFMNRVADYQVVLTLSIDFYQKVNKVRIALTCYTSVTFHDLSRSGKVHVDDNVDSLQRRGKVGGPVLKKSMSRDGLRHIFFSSEFHFPLHIYIMNRG